MRTLWAFVCFVVGWAWTIACSSTTLLIMLLGKPQRAWLATCRPWARGSVKIIRVVANVHGAEHLKGPVIFVSNHQSLLDVIVLPAVLPRRVKWIAKAELKKVPVWGPAFGSAGAVFINRRSSAEAIAAIGRGLEGLPDGWSVVVFPEGTRPEDDSLGPFKKGAFHIALQTRLPVVPIGHSGARDALPSGRWLIRPGRIEITVGPPIPTTDWTADEGDERTDQIRDAVEACVAESKARLAAPPEHTRPGVHFAA